MNLQYLQVGKKPLIEIDSSPSGAHSGNSSAERRGGFDELFATSTERKQMYQIQQDQPLRHDRDSLSITPKKLSLTPIKQSLSPICKPYINKLAKGKFDLSSIFAKKDVEVINSSAGNNGYQSSASSSHFSNQNYNLNYPGERLSTMFGNNLIQDKKIKEKNEEPSRPDIEIDEAALREEMKAIHEFAKDAAHKANEMIFAKDIEILEQRTFYIQKIRELSDKVTELLSENVMLKEIQNELEKSAEKITVFRSDKKSLSICSYLYDSWRNRESKLDLYQKFVAKSRAYDELLEKYAELEKASTFSIPHPNSIKTVPASSNTTNKKETAAQKAASAAIAAAASAVVQQRPSVSKPPTPISKHGPAPVTPVVQQTVEGDKRRRGRKPKVIEPIGYDIEILSDDDDVSEPPLTKKALLALEKETSSKRGFPQKQDQDRSVIALSTTSRKPSQSQRQQQLQQKQQSKSILDEKTSDYQNTRNRSRHQQQPSLQQQQTQVNGNNSVKPNTAISRGNESQKGRENVGVRNSQNSRSTMMKKKESSSDDDFDDNRSSTSAISSLNANKRDSKYKKLLAKERRKNMVETQETTFNSIADTLFNF